MKKPIVVDANVLIAALLRPNGWAAGELRVPGKAWVVPDWAWQELAEHEDVLARRSGVPLAEFHEAVVELGERMRTLSGEELAASLNLDLTRRAREVDERDGPYLAAYSAVGASCVWTFDKRLQEAFPGIAVPVVPEE